MDSRFPLAIMRYKPLAIISFLQHPPTMDPRHQRSSPMTDLDSVFTMAQHQHTLRARQISRTPSLPASPSEQQQPKRPFRRLPDPPKPKGPKPRRLPDPPLSSPASISSFASTSSSGKSSSSSIGGNPDNVNSSYLTFEDDSDTDLDELEDLSESTWPFVEFQGKAFPLPRVSLPPTPPNQSFLHFNRSPLASALSLTPPTNHPRSRLPSPSPSRSQILLRELGKKELEPIGPVMEPAIFADDGAQGDWRQMVDDLFMRD